MQDVALPGAAFAIKVLSAERPTATATARLKREMTALASIPPHPNLVRILMPADWEGYPLRKDYPLGGEPVRFSGEE